MREYTIQFRIDTDIPEKHEIFKNKLRDLARDGYTTALLLKEQRDPQVAIMSSDFIEGNEEIGLFDDDKTGA